MDSASDLGSDGESLRFFDRCDHQPEDALVPMAMLSDNRPMYCPHRMTVWCALCYGRFARSKNHYWLTIGRIIGENLPEKIVGQKGKISTSIMALFTEGFMFQVDDPEACGCEDCFYHVEAYSPDFLEVDHGLPDSDMIYPGFIPVHDSCFRLYKQYLSGRLPTSTVSVDSIHADDFDRIFKEYEDILFAELGKFDIWNEVDSLNGHFGALDSFRWTDVDQFPSFLATDGFVYNATCSNRVFDMDPFTIDSSRLTAFVLSHLKPILFPRPKPKKGTMSSIQRCLGDRLPQEILDMIADFLSISCIDLNQERSGLMPASWWKQELIKGKLLPWLYDLDRKMIEKKARTTPKNWFGAPGTWTEWDWEGLVRELSQTEFYKDLTIHAYGVGEQLALKNRRRIFLIMDDLSKFKPGQKRRKMDIDWADDDCPTREEEEDSLEAEDEEEEDDDSVEEIVVDQSTQTAVTFATGSPTLVRNEVSA